MSTEGLITEGDSEVSKALAVALLIAVAGQAYAKDTKDPPNGPQWHFMDKSADMKMAIHPWCVPRTPQWASCAPKKGNH
jgi:hypothetical protein